MSHPNFVGNYALNSLFRTVATFVGTDLVTPVAPSSIYLFVKNPLGTTATYLFGAVGASIASIGVGAFARDISLELAGDWIYRWQATGVGQSAEEWKLTVRTSQIL